MLRLIIPAGRRFTISAPPRAAVDFDARHTRHFRFFAFDETYSTCRLICLTDSATSRGEWNLNDEPESAS